VGIGFFIAFIGFQNARLILPSAGTCVRLNPQFASPDMIVFFFGLIVTVALRVRRVHGACCGTSTVTSFVESAVGIEQGGRTRDIRWPMVVVCLILLMYFVMIRS